MYVLTHMCRCLGACVTCVDVLVLVSHVLTSLCAVSPQEELLKKRGGALVRRGRLVIEDMRAREAALHRRMDVLLGERFRGEMEGIEVSAAVPPTVRCLAVLPPAHRTPSIVPHTFAYICLCHSA